MRETETAEAKSDPMALTADIISAYVSNNTVAVSDLPRLIQSVHQTLAGGGAAPSPAPEESAKATAAQIRKSISPDALISFEDGKPYKTLKRHLTKLGLTLQAYKAKWGLPNDYPTTAFSYSARRSEMAKSLGLGTKTKGGGAEAAPQRKKTK